MKLALVLDAPSYRAINEGELLTRQTKGLLRGMGAPQFDVYSLFAEPVPKSQTKSQAMSQAKSALANLPLAEYTTVVGFGQMSSWLLTGYTMDAAWGAPTIKGNQSFYGFYDLDYIFNNRGVLIPMLHALVNRLGRGNKRSVFEDSALLIETPEIWEALSGADPKITAVDIENNPSTGQIMRLGLTLGERCAISVPWDEYESGKWGYVPQLEALEHGAEIRKKVLAILADPSIVKVGHNFNFDVKELAKRGIEVRNYEDTLAMHHVLYPDAPHSLGFVAAQYLATPPWKKDFHSGSEEKGIAKFVKRNPRELGLYNAKDCIATIGIWYALRDDLTQQNLLPLATRQQKLFDVALKISQAGIMFDKSKVEIHRENLGKVMERTKAHIAKYAGDINPNSVAQLRKYFFAEQGEEPVKYTAKGAPSIDEDVLSFWKGHKRPEIREVAQAILAYREAQKLRGSYLENALEFVEADGRVHPDVRPYGAKTGRWSIKDPAIQTIPKKMRDLYRVPDGKVLIYPDYSQLELKIVAALAHDEPMLRTFLDGIRIHTVNARAVFGLAQDVKPTDEQETLAKGVVYATNYGAVASTIFQNLSTAGVQGVTLEFCEKLLENWYAAHPALKTYLEETYKRALKDRYLKLPLSGRRLTWWVKPKRQDTANWPIQGTGADIIDEGLLKLSSAIDWDETKIIGQIHDALLIETPLEQVVQTCELIQEHMTYRWPVMLDGVEKILTINLGFNISEPGGNWYSIKEYKTLQKVKEVYGQKSSRGI